MADEMLASDLNRDKFPFRKGDCVQHVSGGRTPIFIIRLVDDEIRQAYAEDIIGNGNCIRIVNPDNLKLVPHPMN
jgi:hypothetical protein